MRRQGVPDVSVDEQSGRVWVNAGWSLDNLYEAMPNGRNTLNLSLTLWTLTNTNHTRAVLSHI